MFEVIQTVESNPVTLALEIFPESLSWDAVRIFKDLYRAKEELDKGTDVFKTVDIKEIVFKHIDDKKKTFKLDLNGIKYVIAFKLDIPEESVFKKLKKILKDVVFFYQESDNVIYNTGVYITLTTGEWMIRTNKYSGVVLKGDKRG
jgi:hypothetical protein